MPQKLFICIQCQGNKSACTFSPGGDRLPMICGWDEKGRMIKPDWQEVPEEKLPFALPF